MPRHRIEREPRHRAQRPTRESARRVQFRPAPPRQPSHAKPPEGPTPAEWLASVGGRVWPYQRRLLTGAARGLLVSPWFAAGAGFVIAAGAFIYAPHAELSFGMNPGRTTCAVPGCTVQAGVPPVIAGTGGGLVTASPSPSAATRTGGGRHAKSDSETFTYAVQPTGSGTFQMTLTVTSDRAIGQWQLSIEIPGATKISVVHASGQLSATADPTPSGTPSDSGSRTGISDAPSPSTSAGALAVQGTDQANSLILVIDGAGTPTAPQHSYFNDIPIRFSLS